jgi:hypothetical protein
LPKRILKKSDAEGAGEQLRNRGFSVEVSRGADGESWLAQATSAAPRCGEQMEELRDQMEALATQFRGRLGAPIFAKLAKGHLLKSLLRSDFIGHHVWPQDRWPRVGAVFANSGVVNSVESTE